MSAWIQSKPIEQITWEDLQSLISDGVGESQQIEFKQGIPGDKANGERWEREGKLADSAKSAICAELSAFLNSYGGTLFLGVEEGREDPRPAKVLTPVPRAMDLAKRFEDVIRSFDPPTSGIAVRSIPSPDDSGKGALVFRVSKSTMAPHGFGSPSVAYIRRGASTMPMSMREMQSVFWETRTLAERVLFKRERFEEQRKKLLLEAASVADGYVLKTWANPTLSWPNPGLSFRVSAIPQLRIAELDLRPVTDFVFPARPTATEFGLVQSHLWDSGHPNDGWTLRAHGMSTRSINSFIDQIFEVEDDGSVSISCFLQCPPGRGRSPFDSSNKHILRPSFLYEPVAQAMYLANMLRLLGNSPGIPIEIDVMFEVFGKVFGVQGDRDYEPYLGKEIRARSEIGPLVWRHREDALSVFSQVEKQICAACGFHVSNPVAPKFEEVFRQREALIAK